MGLFRDSKKMKPRTPARNTYTRSKEAIVSNLGVVGMVRKLKQFNPGISIERSVYRGSEVIVIDVKRLNVLRFPKGYTLIGTTLTNSSSKEGMHEDIQLITKFDYNFTR